MPHNFQPHIGHIFQRRERGFIGGGGEYRERFYYVVGFHFCATFFATVSAIVSKSRLKKSV